MIDLSLSKGRSGISSAVTEHAFWLTIASAEPAQSVVPLWRLEQFCRIKE